MINERQSKKFCCEDIALIENYDEAYKSDEMYAVHHKLGLWFNRQWLKDNGFYYEQRAEMLMFMKLSEHMTLHSTGHVLSDRAKEKIRKSRIGKSMSDETKRKISEAKKNPSDETRRKLSMAKKGMVSPNKGKNLSNEVIENMLKAHEKFRKKVYQYTKSGDFVAEYSSITEASRLLGICNGHISKCCLGKRKTAGGYCWRLKEM